MIPSSMDNVETAIIASSLETIDRIGPCAAKITVKEIQDVRNEMCVCTIALVFQSLALPYRTVFVLAPCTVFVELQDVEGMGRRRGKRSCGFGSQFESGV